MISQPLDRTLQLIAALAGIPEVVMSIEGPQSIDKVGVCVTGPARALAFYETLGFVKAFDNERGCTLIVGDAKLFLFRTRQADPQERRGFSLFQNPPGFAEWHHASGEEEAFDEGREPPPCAGGNKGRSEPCAR